MKRLITTCNKQTLEIQADHLFSFDIVDTFQEIKRRIILVHQMVSQNVVAALYITYTKTTNKNLLYFKYVFKDC